METIKEYSLDNAWYVVFTPENLDEEGRPFNVLVTIARREGKDLDHQIDGQIKRDGCCDFGFNENVMMHFCGQKDSTLFSLVFNDAIQILGSAEDEL